MSTAICKLNSVRLTQPSKEAFLQLVKRVITYYCEACQTAYDNYADAERCEQSARPKLALGDIILRGARGGYGFELENGGLIWGVVKQIREVHGQSGAPYHQFFYTTSGLHKEVAEHDLMIPAAGGLALERGLSEGLVIHDS